MTALTSWTSATGAVMLLDGSAGVKLQRGAHGLDGPPIANTLDTRVTDGSVRVNQRRPLRPISLALFINTNVTSVGAVVAAFQGPGTLTADSGRALRSVVYEGGLEGEWSIGTGGVIGLNFRRFTVSLLALDPWWYGPSQLLSGTFGAGTAWNAAILWNAAIPWDGGSAYAIVNPGDVATYCTAVIKGAATTATMSINGKGGWKTAKSIASNDYLSVSGETDRRGPHRGPHGLFAVPDGPIDWSLLSASSQMFDLPAGESSLIFGATGTDANSAWYISYSPRYFTP